MRITSLNVNPKARIPAMTGNVLYQPLTDSISISLYLTEKALPGHAAGTARRLSIRNLLREFIR